MVNGINWSTTGWVRGREPDMAPRAQTMRIIGHKLVWVAYGGGEKLGNLWVAVRSLFKLCGIKYEGVRIAWRRVIDETGQTKKILELDLFNFVFTS